MTLTDREQRVLARMRAFPMGYSPSVMTRCLNLASPCDWCPVLPPKPGEQCAVVPEDSRCRVLRVLESLVKKGAIQKVRIRGRRHTYLLHDEELRQWCEDARP